jgi:hypothetical protein
MPEVLEKPRGLVGDYGTVEIQKRKHLKWGTDVRVVEVNTCCAVGK